MRMRSIPGHCLIVAVFAAFVAGCSSTPVAEPAPTPTAQAARPAAAPSQRPVAPVTANQAVPSAMGPAGAAKIVYFEFDSYEIKPQFQQIIEAHARYLRANPTRRIVVEGHTDERGGREYNIALGQQRSEAVTKALTLLGAGRQQIEAVSFGEEKPAAAGADESAWSRNRRAEIAYRP